MAQETDKILIRKFIAGNCSTEEQARMKIFMQQSGSEALFNKVLNEDWQGFKKEEQSPESYIQNFQERLNERLADEHRSTESPAAELHKYAGVSLTKEQHPSHQPKKVSLWAKAMIAASVLIISTLGAYLLLNRSFRNEQSIATSVNDFAPGSNKAILTLGNGKHITLNEAHNGELAREGNAMISKEIEGAVVYSQNGSGQPTIWNTLSTPRGGHYRLVLADGTRVYLNAASSISYPASFSGKFREVEITGEVYFEVAHNAHKPFQVKTGTQRLKVLGTHFNINAYQEMDAIKTTLLEGSVAITSAGKTKILKPGQQAVATGNTIGLSDVDIAEVTAWKDGFFDFTDADIQTVMQEFSRWYDLDIVFDGPQTKETFTGRIPRSWSFAKVMKIMETFKSSHVTVEGRRIMVRQ